MEKTTKYYRVKNLVTNVISTMKDEVYLTLSKNENNKLEVVEEVNEAGLNPKQAKDLANKIEDIDKK